MKRFIISFASAVIGTILASVPLSAQTTACELEELSQARSLIQNKSPLAEAEVNQVLKGKNKKNPVLLAGLGGIYLKAGNVEEAKKYADLAKKADNQSAPVYILEGDIARSQKEIGAACQAYEQAIYFDPQCKEGYLRYADAYKNANPQLAIEKLLQLKTIDPSYAPADQVLADIYYNSNQFGKASEVYARFINSPEADEEDFVQYAFALFLNHDFEKSLQIAQKGLEHSPRHATFNRLSMYNHTDMKQYEKGLEAADRFFNASDNPDFSYLDHMYYGHLLNASQQYDEAIAQYQKAMQKDSKKANLWLEISDAYESKGDYEQAVDSYRKYLNSQPTEKQTINAQLKLGKLFYAQGTSDQAESPKTEALQQAVAVFAEISQKEPGNYIGSFWLARAHSALDPETTQGLAKPYYESVITLVNNQENANNKPVLIECYSYLGYYYLVANKYPESKEYWNKILGIDPGNTTAQKALEGIN